MAKNFYLIIIFSLVLISCSNTTNKSLDPQIFHFVNENYGYSIDVPSRALISWKGEPPSQEEQTGFGTYPIFTKPTEEDFDISIKATIPSEKCKNLGVSKPESVENINKEIKTIKGRVDFYEIYQNDFPAGEIPRCRPAGGLTGVGYALCSEKNDVEILICISQMKDDSDQAKEIFETFRWIK